MAVRAVFWGVWGGFPPIIGHTCPPPCVERGGLGGTLPPHSRAYLAPLCAERGGLGGILPPILGRKDSGGRGEAGEKGGSGRGSAAPSVVVCLSVAMRTSPSCLGQSRRNFRGWSGSWSGTFISGTGLIGQGSGKKRAGNSNFGRFSLKIRDCFGQCFDFVWMPGGTPCNLVMPGGH